MTTMRRMMAVLFCLQLVMSVSVARSAEGPGKGPKLNFGDSKRKHGLDAIKAVGDRLPEVARHNRVSTKRLTKLLENEHDLWVTDDSRLLYICEGLACPEHAPAEQALSTNGPHSSFDAPYPLSQTFLLHSRPGATKTIFLDFDGQTFTNSTWENGGNLKLAAYYSVFDSTTKTQIQQIWARVAEDFAPFDVDVTTEDPGREALIRRGTGDTQWGIRACFTRNQNLLTGNAIINAAGGGTAYLYSFGDITSEDLPALIFNTGLYTGSQTASHEIGHTVGLHHKGNTPSTEYYPGHGSGSTSWAPIMGASWLGNDEIVVQWSKGEYYLANNTEDELERITTFNGFGYRADDHGNTNTSATSLTPTGNVFTVRGVIETDADVDFFAFTTGGSVTIAANPFTAAPNLDILARLYDSSGNLVQESNPGSVLNISMSAVLAAGTYYLSIEGTGCGNPFSSTPSGYTSYASLGQYELTITVSPTVSCALTAPANGATFAAPASITLQATAGSSTGTIAKVEFFNGGTLLGEDTTSPYSWTWTNVTAGSYTLTAKATDNGGATNTSAAVNVTVTQVTYTVTYNANGATGGSVPASQIKTNGVALTLATNSGNLVRPGYILTGWNTAANGSGADYAEGASYTVEAAVTLYAKWQDNGIKQQIPFVDGFETNTVTLGDLNGQNNWVVSAVGAALVQADETYAGARALKIDAPATVTVSQALTSTASVVWLDLMQKVIAGPANAARPNAAVAFLFNTNGYLMVWDGAQSAGSEWVTLSNHTPMGTGVWARLTARADFSAQTWSLYLNGTSVADNLGFATNRTGLGGVRIQAKAGVFDEVYVGTSNPIDLSTNVPPSCALTAPTNGASFTAPASITLTADASDTDGTVTKVEFFNGATLLGEDTASPYGYDWSNVTAGSYTLTARATDNVGAMTTSAVANITVTPATYTVSYNANGATGGDVPASQTKTNSVALTLASNSGSLVKTGHTFIGWNTAADGSGTDYAEGASYTANAAATLYAKWQADNQAPSCALTAPTNGATFTAPASITLTADASDTDGTVVKVEFFNGATKLGEDTTSPYQYDWTGVAAGAYTLTATATDDDGATNTSAAVNVTVAPATYTVDYNANGATGGSVPASQTKTNGVALTLATNSGSLVKTGSTFSGWNTAADGSGTDYAESASYTVEAAVTLYAKWQTGNVSPTCALTAPTNGASFTAPASITLTADASDTDGMVTKVEFFNGDTLLHEDTTSPYRYDWTGVGAGSYTLTARATDNDGAVTTSAVANITVTPATYAVTYNANGATGGTVPASQTKTNGVALTLASNSGNLVKAGSTFAGWNTAADGNGTDYAEGASYTVDAAVTLYAKWQANGLDQLPFVEGFETNTVAMGDLDGQNNWTVSAAGAALVQADEKYAGDRALKIEATNTVTVSQALTTTASLVWLDLMQKVVAAPTNGARPDAAVAFRFDANGRLVVWDGLQSAGSEWVTLTNHTPMAQGVWTRLTAKADYTAQTWALYLNGTNVAENLGFATNRTGLSEFRIEVRTGVLDEVSVVLDRPVGLSDGGGSSEYGNVAPDSWYLDHFQSLTYGDGDDPDRDGMSNLDEYRAGSDPSDPASCLRFMDAGATATRAGEVVIRWQSETGKVYTIKVATNLAAGFDSTLATGIEATPPINTHTDRVDGISVKFYRIVLE
ncbi:MAG: hypothetical protein FJ224_05995 [Lentisphaerae bacterium]|nr:hypothetical protein [Lentisphaerota bacterium]